MGNLQSIWRNVSYASKLINPDDVAWVIKQGDVKEKWEKLEGLTPMFKRIADRNLHRDADAAIAAWSRWIPEIEETDAKMALKKHAF